MTPSTSRSRLPRQFTRAAANASALTLLTATLVLASTGAPAPSASEVRIPTIADFSDGSFPCEVPHLSMLSERRQAIADAPTVEEARKLALSPARAARRALQVAVLIAPSSEKITSAKARLEGFEDRVEASETPSAVAGEFGHLLDLDMRSGNLVQVADLDVGNASVRGPGRCHYSTGEIVAIVFGFILFIIPGIILLIVLC